MGFFLVQENTRKTITENGTDVERHTRAICTQMQGE